LTPASAADAPRVVNTPEFVALAARLGEAVREAVGEAPALVMWVANSEWLNDSTGRLIEGAGVKVTGLAERAVVLSPAAGASADRSVLAARAAAEAGANTFVVLESCAGVMPDSSKESGREIVLVADHINLTGENPLVGPNVAAWGVRFPDMTEPYTPALRASLSTIGREVVLAGIPAATGGITSQDLEGAELLGASVVSSGVVRAVIAARHSGLRVAACCIVLTHQESIVPTEGRALVRTVLGCLTE
jgi:Phosphorylase superfamily